MSSSTPPTSMSSSNQQPPASNHDISAWASSNAIIGERFSANVQSINGSPAIKQVVWQATGAVYSENYSNQLGSFVAQQSVTDQFGGPNQPPMPNSDVFSSNWGNQPGQQSVTATVTFSDGVTNSQTVNVNVIAPDVDNFQVTAGPFAWSNDQSNKIGFTTTTPITMTATVTIPQSQDGFSGEIGLIQKINRTDTITNSISGQHVLNTNGFVLDTVLSATDPAGSNYLDSASETPCDNEATGQFSVEDYPNSGWRGNASGTDKASGNYDDVTNVKTSISLEDFLVFRTSGGIWVNLQTTAPITMTGEESYDIPTQKWSDVVPSTPQASTPTSAHTDYNIVTWTDWYGNPAINYTPGWNR